MNSIAVMFDIIVGTAYSPRTWKEIIVWGDFIMNKKSRSVCPAEK